jgi:hypothetical protein
MKFLLRLVLLVALPLGAQVKITQGDNKVSVEIDGKPYTEFFYGPEFMKPYLHPLRAATGTIVTRHYPMEKVEGESTDHMHHRGLWFAHSDVNGFDFWNNEKSYKTPNRGSINVTKIDKITSGKQSGTIEFTADWVEPSGKKLLTEKRTMVFRGGKNRTMDFDITLTATAPVKFNDAKDGVFALRLAAGLEELDKKSPPSPPRKGLMVSADGCKTEKECWGKKSNWMDDSGEVDGEKVGVAILDHPDNPRHPTYWHVRGYGLFGANIFGVKDFTHDKTADGSMSLDPGQSIRFRYRVIVHSGDAQSAGLEQEYETYAGHVTSNK